MAVILTPASSCVPRPVNPDETGGELLPDTEGYDYLGGNPFSLSPDGRWLLFSRSVDLAPLPASSGLEEIMLRDLSAYVLYDLALHQGTRVALGADGPGHARRVGG